MSLADTVIMRYAVVDNIIMLFISNFVGIFSVLMEYYIME